MKIQDVWSFTASKLSQLLPECEVTAAFDPLESLARLETLTQPIAVLTLETQSTEAITNTRRKVLLTFSLTFLQALPDNEAEKREKACAVLELANRAQDALNCSLDYVGEEKITFLTADPDGNFFDIQTFTEENLFAVTTAIQTQTFRELSKLVKQSAV